MPYLSKDGQRLWFPNDQVQDAVKLGWVPGEGEQVHVLSPVASTPVAMDVEDADKFTPEPQASVEARGQEAHLEREYGGARLSSYLEAGAQGVTAGLYAPVAVALGRDPEAMREGLNRAPGAGLVEGVAAIAPAFFTGGAGAAGTLARLAPAGAIAKVGGKVAAKYGLAAGGVVEGMAFGAGMSASELALSEHPVSAEAAIAGVAKGALWGAALGGAGGLAVQGASRAFGAAKASLSKRAAKVGGSDDAAERKLFDAELEGWKTTERAHRAEVDAVKAEHKLAREALGNESAARVAARRVEIIELKAEEASLSRAATEMADDAAPDPEVVREVVVGMGELGANGRGVSARLKQISDLQGGLPRDARAAYKKLQALEDAFHAPYFDTSGSPGRTFKYRMRDEAVDIIAKDPATAQRLYSEYAEAVSDAYEAVSALQPELPSLVKPQVSGIKDPDTAFQALAGSSKTAAKTTAQKEARIAEIRSRIVEAEKEIATTKGARVNAASSPKLAELETKLSTLKAAPRASRPRAPRASSEKSQGLVDIAMTVGLEALPGPFLPAYLAGKAAKALISNRHVAAKTLEFLGKTSEAIEGFMRSKAVKASVGPIAGSLAVSLTGSTEPGPKASTKAASQYLARVNELRALAANREGVSASVYEKTSGLRMENEMLADNVAAGSERCIDYLTGLLPPDMQQGQAFGGKPFQEPTREDMDSLAIALRVLHEPLVVLEDMKAGRLVEKSVQALQAMYPEKYAHVRQQFVERIGQNNASLAYDKRLELSTLFRSPFDSIMSHVGDLQGSYAEAHEQDQQAAVEQRSLKLRADTTATAGQRMAASPGRNA